MQHAFNMKSCRVLDGRRVMRFDDYGHQVQMTAVQDFAEFGIIILFGTIQVETSECNLRRVCEIASVAIGIEMKVALQLRRCGKPTLCPHRHQE